MKLAGAHAYSRHSRRNAQSSWRAQVIIHGDGHGQGDVWEGQGRLLKAKRGRSWTLRLLHNHINVLKNIILLMRLSAFCPRAYICSGVFRGDATIQRCHPPGRWRSQTKAGQRPDWVYWYPRPCTIRYINVPGSHRIIAILTKEGRGARKPSKAASEMGQDRA